MPLRIWSARSWIETTAWMPASEPAGDRGEHHARDPGAELVRAEDAEERAHQQHALEADVHHAAALGEHAAEGGEDQRRGVAEHRGGERRPDDDRLEVGDARLGGHRAERAEDEPDPDRDEPEPPLAPQHGGHRQGRARRSPITIGTAGWRTRNGGTATRSATTPRTIAPMAIARSRVGACARAQACSALGHAAVRSGRTTACWGTRAVTAAGGRALLRGRRGRRKRGKPAPLPEVEDQDVGADEQQHERLDHRRQVAGELGLEDVRVEAARRGAVEQGAEQQRREEDADRGVAPEQRDGDADEADREVWTSSWPSRNCQPRMSIAPPSPANAPAIAIARK